MVTNIVFFGSLFTFFSKEFEIIFSFFVGIVELKIFSLFREIIDKSQLIVLDVLTFYQVAEFVDLDHLLRQSFAFLNVKLSFEKSEISFQALWQFRFRNCYSWFEMVHKLSDRGKVEYFTDDLILHRVARHENSCVNSW